MVFRPRQRRQTLDLSIQIDINKIDCVKETVFLGVILEGHLSWKPLTFLASPEKYQKPEALFISQVFVFPKLLHTQVCIIV